MTERPHTIRFAWRAGLLIALALLSAWSAWDATRARRPRASAWCGPLTEVAALTITKPGERALVERRSELLWTTVSTGAVTRESAAPMSAAQALFQALPSLGVKRVLEPAPPLEELGLGEGQRVEVLAKDQRGERYILWLGHEAVGHRELYGSCAAAPDRVMILDAAQTRPLRFASTRLIDRRALQLDEREVEAVSLAYEQLGALEFEQREPQDPELSYWRWPLRSGQSRELRRFMSMLLGTLHLGEVAEGSPQALVTLTLTVGQARQRLELGRSSRGWATRSFWTAGQWMKLDAARASRLADAAKALYAAKDQEALIEPPQRQLEQAPHQH